MKNLALLGLVLGLAAIGVAVYGLVETLPNYESLNDQMMAASSPMSGARFGDLEQALRDDYRDTLGMQAVSATANGFLALVLGVLGATKGGNKLGWAAVVLGLAGGIMGALLFP